MKALKAVYRTLMLGLMAAGIAPTARPEIENCLTDGIDLKIYRRRKEGYPIVLVHGLTARGYNDRRLDLFSRQLAGCGYTVYVPRIPGLADFRLTADDVDIVVRTVHAAMGKRRGRAGIMGFSLGATYGLLAAADGRIKADLDFVCAAGAYYSVGGLIENAFRLKERDPYPVLALDKKYTGLLGLSERDRILFEEIMRDYCERKGHFLPEEDELLRRIVSDPAQENIRDMWRADAEAEQMPELKGYGGFGSIEAEIMLLHFRDDILVRAEDSIKICEELKKAGKDPILYMSRGAEHVDLARGSKKGLFHIFCRMNGFAGR